MRNIPQPLPPEDRIVSFPLAGEPGAFAGGESVLQRAVFFGSGIDALGLTNQGVPPAPPEDDDDDDDTPKAPQAVTFETTPVVDLSDATQRGLVQVLQGDVIERGIQAQLIQLDTIQTILSADAQINTLTPRR